MSAEDGPTSDQHMTALEQGESAARALRDALRMIGIMFPSVIGGFPTMGKARVEMGGCPAETAVKLADWIRSRA